mgnify:CR=1 FL=1
MQGQQRHAAVQNYLRVAVALDKRAALERKPALQLRASHTKKYSDVITLSSGEGSAQTLLLLW